MGSRTRSLASLLLVCSLSLTGCDQGTSRLETFAAKAASPAAGRNATVPAFVQAIRGNFITIDAAIDLAQAKLEAVADHPERAADSTAATAFAGVVLDAISQCYDLLPQGPEFLIFWSRVGSLAFRAGEVANYHGRIPEADSLVLAGGPRWQTEDYWRRRPDHDGLAAIIIARAGRRQEALDRLRGRPDLDGPAAEALEIIQKSR